MKTFLIFLTLILVLRYAMPYIIRFALKWFVQKQMRKAQQYARQGPRAAPPFGQAEPQFQQKANGAAPGKVKVAFVPDEQRQRKEFPGGEYVDYEEVK